MTASNVWWREKELVANSTDFPMEVGEDISRDYGVVKSTKYKDAPGRIMPEDEAPYNSVPLIEKRNIKIGDCLFLTDAWIETHCGWIVQVIERVGPNTYRVIPYPTTGQDFSLLYNPDSIILNNEVRIIDPRFVQMMGWKNKNWENKVEKNKNPDIETCPNGHPITCFQGAPYCPTCNTIQLVNEYTGMPTGKWIERF